MKIDEAGRTVNLYPKCQYCTSGVLVPLSDNNKDTSSSLFKAWVCTNSECKFVIRIDDGIISKGKEAARQ